MCNHHYKISQWNGVCLNEHEHILCTYILTRNKRMAQNICQSDSIVFYYLIYKVITVILMYHIILQ